MIWAMNPSGPSSTATDASFSRHTAEGRMTLDLTKPYTEGSAGASTVVSSTGSEQGEGEEEETDRSMSKRNMIVWAHMIIGIFTWLLVFPLGVFIGRFGRTTMRWFPKHRIVQVIGIVLAVVTMFLGFGTIWAQGGHHMNERHHTLGLSLTLLAVFQGLLGQFGHMLWHAKRIRIQNFLHIIIGITIIPLATWNMGLGLELWEWAPPDYAAYIVSWQSRFRCRPSRSPTLPSRLALRMGRLPWTRLHPGPRLLLPARTQGEQTRPGRARWPHSRRVGRGHACRVGPAELIRRCEARAQLDDGRAVEHCIDSYTHVYAPRCVRAPCWKCDSLSDGPTHVLVIHRSSLIATRKRCPSSVNPFCSQPAK